jgi:hypothetical protein
LPFDDCEDNYELNEIMPGTSQAGVDSEEDAQLVKFLLYFCKNVCIGQ